MWILYFFIYLVGVIVSYLMIRRNLRRYNNKWTEQDRVAALLLSVFLSWGAFIIVVIFGILDWFDENKPAKW